MVTFLFWNMGRTAPHQTAARIAARHEVDVLALAECPDPDRALRLSLELETERHYRRATGLCRWLNIYTRLPEAAFVPTYDNEQDRFSIHRLGIAGGEPVLVVFAHLRSALHAPPPDRHYDCRALHHAIRSAEERDGHDRTIVLGDLNSDPFDDGLVARDGLHAVMSRELASSGVTRYQGTEYPRFYNPMWGRFGDTTPGPCGTYYHNKGALVETYWHTLDQVLIRPALLPHFSDESLRVLDHDGLHTLTTRSAHPGGNYGSDHLPIVCSLDI